MRRRFDLNQVSSLDLLHSHVLLCITSSDADELRGSYNFHNLAVLKFRVLQTWQLGASVIALAKVYSLGFVCAW